jgi:hypothetical protein
MAVRLGQADGSTARGATGRAGRIARGAGSAIQVNVAGRKRSGERKSAERHVPKIQTARALCRGSFH